MSCYFLLAMLLLLLPIVAAVVTAVVVHFKALSTKLISLLTHYEIALAIFA